MRDTDGSDGDEGTDTLMGDMEAVRFGDGWTASIRSTDGAVDRFTLYDETGRAQSQAVLDANGNRVEIDLEAGRMASRTFHDDSGSFDWATFTQTFENGTLTGRNFVFDDGRKVDVTLENGEVATRTITEADADVAVFTFSAAGRTVTLTDGAGDNDGYAHATFRFDAGGDLVSRELVLDDTDTVTNSWDANGRTRVHTDVDGSHAWTTHTTVWDASGDLVTDDFV